jgi:hypothetical protein
MASTTEIYAKRTMEDRFLAQAHLWEQIAFSCASETMAAQCREAARQCKEWAKEANSSCA